jgi:hypothetical protein
LIFNKLLDRSALADCGRSMGLEIWLVQTAAGAATLQNVGTCRYLPTKRNISASTDLRRGGLRRCRQAQLLVGIDVDLPVEHPATELQELGPEPLAAPALQGGLADASSGGQLFLIEVNDFHLGLRPNELAGVHEGAVRPASQGAARPGGGMGVNGCLFGCQPGKATTFRILRLFVYFGYTFSHDAV